MDADQQRAVEAILRHDADSTRAELVYYFVHELGVLEREAWLAVVNGRHGGCNATTANALRRSS